MTKEIKCKALRSLAAVAGTATKGEFKSSVMEEVGGGRQNDAWRCGWYVLGKATRLVEGDGEGDVDVEYIDTLIRPRMQEYIDDHKLA